MSGRCSESTPVWHDVPIYGGRDLARDDLWAISAAVALKKREVARQPPQLPRARRASVSLIVAAIAAATPALSFAHPKPKEKDSGQGRAMVRGLLELGDRGRAVARLQSALGITADGIFGPQTLEAVRSFQAGAGLEADGIVGPLTRTALGLDRAGNSGFIELGDRGEAVRAVQRALGVEADGVFGPRTLDAVRSLQARAGLTVDGIVGPLTRAVLFESGRAPGGRGHRHEDGGEQATAAIGPDFDRRLAGAISLAREMGLRIISGYREGATIAAGGNRSDHSYYPSKAVDLSGTAAQMKRYARAVAGAAGVDTVIYSGVGIWTSGSGWHEIQSSVTYRDHVDHVHVDTF